MADDSQENETGKKALPKKRASTVKRQTQSKRRHILNRSFHSSIRTAIKKFKESAPANDKAKNYEMLSEVYSIVDKGVNKSIFKRNKADRLKERLAKFISNQ